MNQSKIIPMRSESLEQFLLRVGGASAFSIGCRFGWDVATARHHIAEEVASGRLIEDDGMFMHADPSNSGLVSGA